MLAMKEKKEMRARRISFYVGIPSLVLLDISSVRRKWRSLLPCQEEVESFQQAILLLGKSNKHHENDLQLHLRAWSAVKKDKNLGI